MADDYDMVVEEGGAPALVLAGATIVDPDTASGNPHHEVGSGRFGNRPGGKPKTTARRQQGVKPQPATAGEAARPDVQRRRDAIVDAARTLTDLSPKGVEELVRRRWRGDKPITPEDIASFADDARRQRIEDIIDMLDGRIRKGVYGRIQAVSISFPRGMAKQSLAGFDQDTVNMILRRLRERGWTADQVRKHVVRRFDDKDKRMASEMGALV